MLLSYWQWHTFFMAQNCIKKERATHAIACFASLGRPSIILRCQPNLKSGLILVLADENDRTTTQWVKLWSLFNKTNKKHEWIKRYQKTLFCTKVKTKKNNLNGVELWKSMKIQNVTIRVVSSKHRLWHKFSNMTWRTVGAESGCDFFNGLVFIFSECGESFFFTESSNAILSLIFRALF